MTIPFLKDDVVQYTKNVSTKFIYIVQINFNDIIASLIIQYFYKFLLGGIICIFNHVIILGIIIKYLI